MRIAIIGGKGMIGSALTRELVNNGHEVVILTRGNPLITSDEKVVEQNWDGKSAAGLASVLNGMDALVNLAGESIGRGRWTEKRKAALLTSRLEPAEAVTEVFQQMPEPPRVFIQAGAVGYYGSGVSPVSEESGPGSDFLSKLCEYWEDASKSIEPITRRVILRSGIVLDRDDGILPQMALPFKLFVGGKMGSGTQWVSWIHIRDEVRAIRFLIENPSARGIYNLTSSTPVTNADFGRALSKVLGKPFWFPLPGFVLRTVLGEMSQLILEGQQVLPKRLLDAGFDFDYPTIESALVDLYKS